MFDEFKNPSNQYRSIPFWFWNSKLDKDELKYQIKEMKKARLGGYFMHARSGLKTEYLSEEWFDCIKTGIEAGKKPDLMYGHMMRKAGQAVLPEVLFLLYRLTIMQNLCHLKNILQLTK